MIYNLTNEIIKKKTESFDFTNPQISAKELFENMKETLVHLKGLGLTCNQVGLPYSMFVFGDHKNPNTIVGCFNPKIVNSSEEKTTMEEGCLSFPGIVVKKERSNEIRVRYQDYLGAVNTKVFTGMTARVFQHEMEHVEGLTFMSGLSKLKMDMLLKKAKKAGFTYKMDKLNEEHK